MPHSCLHLVMHNLGVLGEQTTQRGTSILLLTGNPVQWRTAWLSCAVADSLAVLCQVQDQRPSGAELCKQWHVAQWPRTLHPKP